MRYRERARFAEEARQRLAATRAPRQVYREVYVPIFLFHRGSAIDCDHLDSLVPRQRRASQLRSRRHRTLRQLPLRQRLQLISPTTTGRPRQHRESPAA